MAYQNDERHDDLVALLTRIAVAVEAQAEYTRRLGESPARQVRTKTVTPTSK